MPDTPAALPAFGPSTPLTTRPWRRAILGLLGLALLLNWLPAFAQNGPDCDRYNNKTTANGLGDNFVRGIYAVDMTVYAATNIGLSISTDGGKNFINKTTTSGLGNNQVNGVYVSSTTVYAATNGGLSISTDGGNTFTNKTTANGLGANQVRAVYVISPQTVYAATDVGLSISTNGGNSFTNRTIDNGLGNNQMRGVYVVGTTIYAATEEGLSISTNGGSSFTNKTTDNGLGENRVRGVHAVGTTVYAATLSGLSISTNGGNSFTNKTSAMGLGDNQVRGVYAVGTTVYAATLGGLSISTNGGNSFTNKTTANGLGNNSVLGVYAIGTSILAATNGGVSFCASGALPVTLRYFNGRMTPAGALLGWATAQEQRSSHFLIERSRDLVGFEAIANIPSRTANGESAAELTYQFTDTQPLPGVSYYRLVQVDTDGTRTLFRPIALSREGDTASRQQPVLFPNPVGETGEATLEPALAYTQYELVDGLGRVVRQTDGPGTLTTLSVQGLAAGAYLLRVYLPEGGQRIYRLLR